MPKKEKKKKLKPILLEREVKTKRFQSSVEKQFLFKEYSQYFQRWTSWQRKILLCQCTSHSSMALLISLSTIMEPVFHRDYQVFNTGSFQSSLIKTFSSLKTEEEENTDLPNLSDIIKNEKWQFPINQNEKFQKDKIANVFIQSANNRKNPFDDIELDDLPEKNEVTHKHSQQKRKESVSTLDFFWKYEIDKISTLGNFVRVYNPKVKKKLAGKTLTSEYKHKAWYLPPISPNKLLLKASKSELLKTYKNISEGIIHAYQKWKNAEQGDFFLCLFKLCSPEELVFLGNCIQQCLRNIGDINRLSDKVLLNIFGYLDKTDLHSCSRTCKRWRLLAFHNFIWKRRCYDLAIEYNQLAVLNYIETISEDLMWKDIYKQLDDTVQQLVNVMVLQPNQEDCSYATDNDEDGDVMLEGSDGDEGNGSCDDENMPESLNSSFERLEIVHLSPNKSFGTIASSERSKSTSPPVVFAAEQSFESENTVNEHNEHADDMTDQAFDVRPKLVQPTNQLVCSISSFKCVCLYSFFVLCLSNLLFYL